MRAHATITCIMCSIYFQHCHPDITGSFDFTVYFRGKALLLHGAPTVHLNDLQQFMWNMFHLYEDEQSYTIIDDISCPPLLPGILLSVFSTLYLTTVASYCPGVIPLRYQRWIYHPNRPNYYNTLALGQIAKEHLPYLPTWFLLNPHRSINIRLAHPHIEEIMYLLIIHLKDMPSIRNITLWETPHVAIPITLLHLLYQRLLRLVNHSNPIYVFLQRPKQRLSLEFFLRLKRLSPCVSENTSVAAKRARVSQ